MDGLSLWPNTCSKSETKTLELYITTLYSTLTSTSMTNNSNIMKLHLISMDLKGTLMQISKAPYIFRFI